MPITTTFLAVYFAVSTILATLSFLDRSNTDLAISMWISLFFAALVSVAAMFGKFYL